MNLADLRSFAQAQGFPDPDLAAAVAMAESSGVATAVGDGGQSIGLWQIYTPAHPEYDRSSLFDPAYNARAALAISNGGDDWSPWTTYREGTFRKYMPLWRRLPPPVVGAGVIAGAGASALLWPGWMGRAWRAVVKGW